MPDINFVRARNHKIYKAQKKKNIKNANNSFTRIHNMADK